MDYQVWVKSRGTQAEHISSGLAQKLTSLDQLHPAHAGMPIPADDDMVMHGDAERFRHVSDFPRHLDVGSRRRRIAGGVIVQQPIARATILISLTFFM